MRLLSIFVGGVFHQNRKNLEPNNHQNVEDCETIVLHVLVLQRRISKCGECDCTYCIDYIKEGW
jgi:hypothetical protein